jgi:hypothetical protein
LNDPAHPEWGSWGGRFGKASSEGGLWRDAKDRVGAQHTGRATVWRWRPSFAADFAARMDWCVQPFEKANHAPVAAIDGDRTAAVLTREARAGDSLALSAARSSDPDTGQALRFKWWVYAEAGSYPGLVEIHNADKEEVTLVLPRDGAGKAVHAILEVTDDGEPALTSFRRVVVEMK